ncbi:hypothetical protein [Nodularia sp. UHCC 0506]|uniref:hypothetical protein n=1 Tax=Nodularia sp. UHCC 0506 TaxID=3110243 RepID=UPI002B21DFA0|nr:hypothetical protein [Nodularia sp. UHCC 0506]MEA5513444.1 hypothetical protein [Nodularia sp. UHCC 0506]
MKILRLLTPAALVMTLALADLNSAQGQPLQIRPNSNSEPLVVNGTSGGTVPSNCGNIAKTPNHVMHVTNPLPYLRLTVKGSGQPTLRIEGPGGSFCVLSDTFSETNPEISGFYMPGTYNIHVGDLSQNQYNYTLSISQQKQPIK